MSEWVSAPSCAMIRALRRWLESVKNDARFGLRALRRTPLASVVMVASVALGIGVATAVFTLTDVMLLRPLPYPGAERLVVPYQTVRVRARATQDTVEWTFARYNVLRSAVRGFDDVGFASWVDAFVRTKDADVPIRVEAITRSLLTTFHIRPQAGRLFGQDEDAATALSTVGLISDRLWRTTYGATESIVGTTILVNGRPVTVVGVMPGGFTGFTVAADLWLPVRMTARLDPSPRWMERLDALIGTVIARRASTTTLAGLDRQLRAALTLVNDAAPEPSLGASDERGVGVMSLQEARRHPLVRPMLQLMALGVLSLLLIVCANIASILLARGHARRGELGVRIALGASQRRVGRQVLTESMVLGLLGLPLGVLLGYGSASAIADLRPTLPQNWVLLRGTDLLAGASLTPNVRVVAFAAIVAGLTTLIFGIGPAVVAARIDAARLLTSGAGDNATPQARGRQVLVASQIALATVLLVVAGLMTQSLRGLLRTDLGFQPDGVTTLQVTSMDTSAAARVRRQELVTRLSQTPGIDAIAMTGCRPFDLACMFTVGVRTLNESDASARPQDAYMYSVSADYFRVMRIPVEAGRAFVAADTTGGATRVMLSATAATRLFGTKSPVGERVVFDMRGARPMEVVGVVRDVRFKSVEGAASPAIYMLAGENAQAPRLHTMLFVRSTMPSEAAIAIVARAIRESTTPISIANARSLSSVIRDATSSTRFVATLLVAFAASAVLLAGLGIYGVVSYIVTQRTREFGVRLVLGADGRDLLLSTVRRSVWVVGGGVAVGLVVAGAGARLLGSFLYGIGSFDLKTDLAVVALVTALGLVATFIPARRITRIDPAKILRT